jgi:hypothetical protein
MTVSTPTLCPRCIDRGDNHDDRDEDCKENK